VVSGALSLGVKRTRLEADHLPSFRADVATEWSCTSNLIRYHGLRREHGNLTVMQVALHVSLGNATFLILSPFTKSYLAHSPEQLCHVAVISKRCLYEAVDVHLCFGRYCSLDLAYDVASK